MVLSSRSVDDLAASARERAAQLTHHRIQPDQRACDATLDGWRTPAPTAAGDADAAASRAQLTATFHAHSVEADRAWAAGHADGGSDGGSGAGGGGGGGDEAARKQKLMEAAARYVKLLQLAGSHLDDGHALLLQARGRLAHVMNLSGAQRSQANAWPLWKQVLGALRPCVPPAWPQLLPALRGAATSAAAAGDTAAAEAYRAEVASVLAVLRPGCDDVRDGGLEQGGGGGPAVAAALAGNPGGGTNGHDKANVVELS